MRLQARISNILYIDHCKPFISSTPYPTLKNNEYYKLPKKTEEICQTSNLKFKFIIKIATTNCENAKTFSTILFNTEKQPFSISRSAIKQF